MSAVNVKHGVSVSTKKLAVQITYSHEGYNSPKTLVAWF